LLDNIQNNWMLPRLQSVPDQMLNFYFGQVSCTPLHCCNRYNSEANYSVLLPNDLARNLYGIFHFDE
jgi:hypothetical protein